MGRNNDAMPAAWIAAPTAPAARGELLRLCWAQGSGVAFFLFCLSIRPYGLGFRVLYSFLSFCLFFSV